MASFGSNIDCLIKSGKQLNDVWRVCSNDISESALRGSIMWKKFNYHDFVEGLFWLAHTPTQLTTVLGLVKADIDGTPVFTVVYPINNRELDKGVVVSYFADVATPPAHRQSKSKNVFTEFEVNAIAEVMVESGQFEFMQKAALNIVVAEPS